MCAFLQGFSFGFITLTRVNAVFTGVNHVMGDVSPLDPMPKAAKNP
jgi:hypothetical protein